MSNATDFSLPAVLVHDEAGVWRFVDRRVFSLLPLSGVRHREAESGSQVDLTSVMLAFRKEGESPKPAQAAQDRFLDPILHLCTVKCETVDEYRASVKQQLREWVSERQRRRQEWLLLFVPIRTAGSSDKAYRRVHERLKADFSEGRVGVRCCRLDGNAPAADAKAGASPAAEAADQLDSFAWSLRLAITRALASRLATLTAEVHGNDPARHGAALSPALLGTHAAYFLAVDALGRTHTMFGMAAEAVKWYERLCAAQDDLAGLAIDLAAQGSGEDADAQGEHAAACARAAIAIIRDPSVDVLDPHTVDARAGATALASGGTVTGDAISSSGGGDGTPSRPLTPAVAAAALSATGRSLRMALHAASWAAWAAFQRGDVPGAAAALRRALRRVEWALRSGVRTGDVEHPAEAHAWLYSACGRVAQACSEAWHQSGPLPSAFGVGTRQRRQGLALAALWEQCERYLGALQADLWPAASGAAPLPPAARRGIVAEGAKASEGGGTNEEGGAESQGAPSPGRVRSGGGDLPLLRGVLAEGSSSPPPSNGGRKLPRAEMVADADALAACRRASGHASRHAETLARCVVQRCALAEAWARDAIRAGARRGAARAQRRLACLLLRAGRLDSACSPLKRVCDATYGDGWRSAYRAARAALAVCHAAEGEALLAVDSALRALRGGAGATATSSSSSSSSSGSRASISAATALSFLCGGVAAGALGALQREALRWAAETGAAARPWPDEAPESALRGPGGQLCWSAQDVIDVSCVPLGPGGRGADSSSDTGGGAGGGGQGHEVSVLVRLRSRLPQPVSVRGVAVALAFLGEGEGEDEGEGRGRPLSRTLGAALLPVLRGSPGGGSPERANATPQDAACASPAESLVTMRTLGPSPRGTPTPQRSTPPAASPKQHPARAATAQRPASDGTPHRRMSSPAIASAANAVATSGSSFSTPADRSSTPGGAVGEGDVRLEVGGAGGLGAWDTAHTPRGGDTAVAADRGGDRAASPARVGGWRRGLRAGGWRVQPLYTARTHAGAGHGSGRAWLPLCRNDPRLGDGDGPAFSAVAASLRPPSHALRQGLLDPWRGGEDSGPADAAAHLHCAEGEEVTLQPGRTERVVVRGRVLRCGQWVAVAVAMTAEGAPLEVRLDRRGLLLAEYAASHPVGARERAAWPEQARTTAPALWPLSVAPPPPPRGLALHGPAVASPWSAWHGVATVADPALRGDPAPPRDEGGQGPAVEGRLPPPLLRPPSHTTPHAPAPLRRPGADDARPAAVALRLWIEAPPFCSLSLPDEVGAAHTAVVTTPTSAGEGEGEGASPQSPPQAAAAPRSLAVEWARVSPQEVVATVLPLGPGQALHVPVSITSAAAPCAVMCAPAPPGAPSPTRARSAGEGEGWGRVRLFATLSPASQPTGGAAASPQEGKGAGARHACALAIALAPPLAVGPWQHAPPLPSPLLALLRATPAWGTALHGLSVEAATEEEGGGATAKMLSGADLPGLEGDPGSVLAPGDAVDFGVRPGQAQSARFRVCAVAPALAEGPDPWGRHVASAACDVVVSPGGAPPAGRRVVAGEISAGTGKAAVGEFVRLRVRLRVGDTPLWVAFDDADAHWTLAGVTAFCLRPRDAGTDGWASREVLVAAASPGAVPLPLPCVAAAAVDASSDGEPAEAVEVRWSAGDALAVEAPASRELRLVACPVPSA